MGVPSSSSISRLRAKAPRAFRMVVVVPLFVLILSAPPKAAGQSYQLTSTTGGTSSQKGAYRYSNGQYGSNATAGTNGTATCSGTVTWSFTWSGSTGTEPKSVIIEKFSSATCGGGSGSSASDGLGDPQSGSTSEGTHYEVENNPPHVIPVSFTPSATGVTVQQGNQWLIGSASVETTVSVITVAATIAGTDRNTTSQCLVGQPQSATISASGLAQYLSNYNWTISGTDLFSTGNFGSNNSSHAWGTLTTNEASCVYTAGAAGNHYGYLLGHLHKSESV